jgi:hypothetical protein
MFLVELGISQEGLPHHLDTLQSDVTIGLLQEFSPFQPSSARTDYQQQSTGAATKTLHEIWARAP